MSLVVSLLSAVAVVAGDTQKKGQGMRVLEDIRVVYKAAGVAGNMGSTAAGNSFAAVSAGNKLFGEDIRVGNNL